MLLLKQDKIFKMSRLFIHFNGKYQKIDGLLKFDEGWLMTFFFNKITFENMSQPRDTRTRTANPTTTRRSSKALMTVAGARITLYPTRWEFRLTARLRH